MTAAWKTPPVATVAAGAADVSARTPPATVNRSTASGTPAITAVPLPVFTNVRSSPARAVTSWSETSTTVPAATASGTAGPRRKRASPAERATVPAKAAAASFVSASVPAPSTQRRPSPATRASSRSSPSAVGTRTAAPRATASTRAVRRAPRWRAPR